VQSCDSYITALLFAAIYFWTNRLFTLFLSLLSSYIYIYIKHMYKKKLDWFCCNLWMVKINIVV
jgi:hypothetical protein